MSTALNSNERRSSSTTAGHRILIAEDMDMTRTLMELMLRQDGHDVVSVANGKRVLELLAHESFDLIFLDIEMPELGGLETAQAIRAMDEPTRNTPIVVLTAYKDDEQAGRFQALGIDLIMTKPIDRPILLKLARYPFRPGSRNDVEAAAPSPVSFDGAVYADIVNRYGLQSVQILVASLRQKLDEALSLTDTTPNADALRAIAHQMVIAGTLGFSRLLQNSRDVSAGLHKSVNRETTHRYCEEFKAEVVRAKRILNELGL